MSLCSILFLFIIIKIAIDKTNVKIKYLNYVTLLMIIEVLNINAAFLAINDSFINIKYVMSIFLIIYTLYYIKKSIILIPKLLLYLECLLLLSVIVGIFIEIINPYNGLIINYNTSKGWDLYVLGLLNKEKVDISYGSILILYTKVFLYTITTCLIKTTCNKKDIIYILNNIIKYTRFIIYYGFVEFIIKNVINNLDIIIWFNTVMFGKSSQISFADDVYRLTGVTSEPSYFVISLFTIIIYNIIIKKIIDNDKSMKSLIVYHKKDIFFMIGIMLLTGGFSMVWYLLMVVFLYLILNMKRNFKFLMKLLLFILIIISGIIYFVNNYADEYIGGRLNTALMILGEMVFYGGIDMNNGLFVASSNLARFVSIYDTVIDFVNRPLLGLGLGIETAHSGLAMLLVDFGIIGIYLLFRVVLYRVDKSIKYDKLFIFCFFIIVNIPVGIKNIGFEVFNILFIELTSFYLCKGSEKKR